jgi:MoxR-like ATPase
MSTIEFRCSHCDKLLRVGAAYAGKEARCPQCGTVSTIPNPQPQRHPAEEHPLGPVSSRGPSSAPPDPRPMPAPLGTTTPGMLPVSHPAPRPTDPPRAPAARLSLASSAEGTGTSPTRELFQRIMEQVRKIYVGQDELVLGTLVALFSGGHVLIESFPGLGKTLFVRTLGKTLGCRFGRIQFTADLMPSDITGSPIFDMKEQEFRFRPGPVFTQLLLADEINRSPAKTHAALLEIMQEYHVTADGQTHVLERPFLVMATQNPIESEGTYNLPEAQLDRFMFKLVLDYPAADEEADILKMHSRQVNIDERLNQELQTVTSPAEILETTRQCGQVRIDDRLVDYINQIVRRTRDWPQFHIGASPRAGLALMQGARTLAAFRGRDYAVPDDVVELTLPALRHRVILTAEAEVEGRNVDELLTELVRTVEVPRL